MHLQSWRAALVAMLLAAPSQAWAQSAAGKGQFFLDFGTAVGTLDVEEPPPTDQTLAILADGNPSGNLPPMSTWGGRSPGGWVFSDRSASTSPLNPMM